MKSSKRNLSRNRRTRWALAGLLWALLVFRTHAGAAAFTNVPWSDSAFFPLGVWLQDPTNAAAYRQAGFNTFVGLWRGPTEEQLSELKSAGMYVVCEQNSVARRHLDDTSIIAWMQDDEPDNSRSRGARFGFGSPVPPQEVVAEYQRIKTVDPSRPVLLNLGQGVAWDGWYGRGNRKNHPEDYPKYLQGCDIASFDIYPVVHKSREVAGKLWFVAEGVERLVRWGGTNQMVWNCLECTHVDNPGRKPTPRQVRAEAWMSTIHGSRGLIYFAHQFKPEFREAALLEDPDMLAAVTALNREITSLAPVINSPSVPDVATVQSKNPAVPVAFMIRNHQGAVYLFAVAMRDGETMATFKIAGVEDGKTVEVIGENRNLTATNGLFSDHFRSWDVHLYRMK